MPAGPDLLGTGFEYSVPSDDTREANGPLPVNREFQVIATITNQGLGRSGDITVAIYISTDSVIDSHLDVFVGHMFAPSLSAGTSTRIPRVLQLPEPLSAAFFGTVWLGMVIQSEIQESDEVNNSNRGDALDRRAVQLYDPVPDRGTVPISFSSRDAAESFLKDNGFSAPVRLLDTSWSRPLVVSTFSRFNGQLMPAVAFRIDGYPQRRGRTVGHQGADSNFNPGGLATVFGEPSPRTALALDFLSPGWLLYVAAFHDRF